MLKIINCLFVVLLCFGCQKTNKDSCDDSVMSLYKMADFRVGVAADAYLLESNPAYRNIVINQYNVIVPVSAFLMYKLHPEQNRYDFSEYDYLIDFCKTYNKHFEGANLTWHLYIPDWITNFHGSEQDWENLAKTHIQTIMSHYKGVVESWMIVNEALNEDGTLKNTIWQQHIGNDYIAKFFTWAHEADPNALLFYNDYNLESNPVKLNAAINLADMLRTRGIKIDGIGLQMHIFSNYPTNDEINNAALKVANHDYKVYYSELDISSNYTSNLTSFSAAMSNQQKYVMKNIVSGYKELPKKNQYGITTWGVGDSDSWIRTSYHHIDWPLMFDYNYKSKPAYCGFIEALNDPL